MFQQWFDSTVARWFREYAKSTLEGVGEYPGLNNWGQATIKC